MTLGPYRVGDRPATPVQIDILTDEDLDAYLDFTVTVRDASGSIVASIGPTAFDGDEVTFTWPNGVFATPGIYTLTITLIGAGLTTLEPLSVVVEADTGWLSLAAARSQWTEAPSEDEHLYRLLEVAKTQCREFAPTITGRPPLHYVQAQLLQARALWASGKVSQGDQFGDAAGLSVTVFPMDWTVKNLLRPKRAVGAMF